MEPTEPKKTEGGPVSEQEVIDALDNLGFENDEARALLIRFTEQCEEEANKKAVDAPGDALVSNRANIESSLKVGRLYAKTKNYKGEAIEYLNDLLDSALGHESTQDLATEMILLIEDLGKSED